MLVSSLLGIGLHGQHRQNCFQILESPVSVRRSSSLHTVPEFRDRYRSHLKLFLRLFRQPGPQIKSTLFASNDDIGIQDYCHLSLGAKSRFRDEAMSLSHARASWAESFTFPIASARSCPLQTFWRSGMSRATAFPFFSSTKVVF